MTLLLKQIFQFFKLLNSEQGTVSIAAGITCGMILGFTPAFSLQTILVILLLFLLRIQIGAALLTAAFFKIVAYGLDPIFDRVGQAALEAPALQGLWTELYNAPLLPFTRFNNSVVMGSGIVAILLAPLCFLAAVKLVRQYRAQVVARFQQTKVWKAWKATTFYQWYTKYDALKSNLA